MLIQPGYASAKFEALRIEFFPEASPEILEGLRFMFMAGIAAGANPSLSDVDRMVLNHQVIMQKPNSPPKDGIKRPNLQPSLN